MKLDGQGQDVTARRWVDALERNVPVLCLCLTHARTPDVVLIAGASGFDAIYVDLEHSVTPLDVTSMLCTTALGCGLLPFVRVPSLDVPTITRVLDGGALGIIVPHVDTPEQARVVVDACRFPPVGRRTLYGMTPLTGYRPRSAGDLTEALDRDLVVAPMIESRAAVENAEQIAATEGVDLLLVGAHDLSVDLGVAGRVGDAAVAEALGVVAEACATHGRCFGIAGIADAEILRRLIPRGLRFVSAGTDAGLLRQAGTARVDELRRLLIRGKDENR
jgi:2-keto-3-deoxy-L-rhamnonate aldolase RhmA